MRIWGINKKYRALSWWENFTGGHLSFWRITIFGANAVHWVFQFRTSIGVICITLPTIDRLKGKRDWYIYVSPNCTPWACTFYIGSDKSEHIRAKIRRMNLGHNFNASEKWSVLQTINNKFSWFSVTAYDVSRFGPKEGEYKPKEDSLDGIY